MKKPVQIHQFDPVIYPVKLFVIKHPTEEVINNNFEEYNGSKISFSIGTHNFAATYNKIVVKKDIQKYGVLINLYRNTLEVSKLAHEATHAARVIWDWLCEDSTGAEADAYLVGWIVDCIDQVNKNKFKTS